MKGKLIGFLFGLYIGKYYSKYVPIPQITKENVDKGLKYLESLSK